MKVLLLSSALLCSLLLTGCGEKDSADKKLNNAVNLAKQNNWAKAASEAAALAEEYPNTIAPRLLQVLAYEKNGELAKAVDLAHQCVKASPNDFTARYTLGRLYSLDSNRSAEAFTELEKALQLNPGHIDTLVLLCNLGVARNEPNTEKYIDRLQKSAYPHSNRIIFLKGVNQAANGNQQEAVNNLYRAAMKSKKEPLLILNAARVIDNSKLSPQKARNLYTLFISFYKRVPNHDPKLIKEAQISQKRLSRRR